MAGELFSGGVSRRPCCDSYGNEWHARPCNVNGPTGLGPSGVGCFSPVPSARCGGDGCTGCAWCEREVGKNEYWMARGVRVVETDLIPPGPIIVGEFTWDEQGAFQEFTTNKTCRVPGCDHDPDNLNCVNPGRWGEQGTVGCAGAHHTSDGICVGHSPGELVGCAMEDIEVDGNDRVALPVSSGHCEVCGFAKVVCRGDHTPWVRGPARDFGYFFAEKQVVIKPDFNPMDPWGPARLRIAEDKISSDRTFENETRLH